MSELPQVVAVGHVDREGVGGTGGRAARWQSLGVAPPGDGRTFRRIFGVPDPAFRRLDRVARTLVLATEASGLAARLPMDVRDETAIVLETERGALDTDLRFLRQLQRGIVEGPVFPYTLPSAGLGEVAVRHGLRGPTTCLSVGPGESGAALVEARHLLEAGEARFVLAALVEVLGERCGPSAPALRAVVALLAGSGERNQTTVARWPQGGGDPYEELVAALA